MKAPATARALPKLCERARQEEWSYERFTEAVLSTEIASRDASGGELRITAARFPATEWVAVLADAQRQGRLDEELRRLERYPCWSVTRWAYPV